MTTRTENTISFIGATVLVTCAMLPWAFAMAIIGSKKGRGR